MKTAKFYLFLISLIAIIFGSIGFARAGNNQPILLVSNSAGDSVSIYSQHSAKYLGELISTDSGLLDHPDSLVIGPDGALYVSTGTTPANSAILRFDLETGDYLGVFASGNGMHRPYGFTWGPDGLLYVASFLSDQLLRFDGTTGAFVDVFAEGDALPGGCNGPDDLAFGPDGAFYLTTQGSVAVNGSPTYPGLPSEVVRYDLNGSSSVFAQPDPSPEGFGFVSLLGIKFGPNCEKGNCDLWISDFANDIRRYDLDGNLIQVLSTNYTGTQPSSNFVGNITFGKSGTLFCAAFNNSDEATPGAIMRWKAPNFEPFPKRTLSGALFVDETTNLIRPIGILAVP